VVTHTIPDLCGFTTIPDLWLTHTISDLCGYPLDSDGVFHPTQFHLWFHPHDS
jgi:hypothetical protein